MNQIKLIFGLMKIVHMRERAFMNQIKLILGLMKIVHMRERAVVNQIKLIFGLMKIVHMREILFTMLRYFCGRKLLLLSLKT